MVSYLDNMRYHAHMCGVWCVCVWGGGGGGGGGGGHLEVTYHFECI